MVPINLFILNDFAMKTLSLSASLMSRITQSSYLFASMLSSSRDSFCVSPGQSEEQCWGSVRNRTEDGLVTAMSVIHNLVSSAGGGGKVFTLYWLKYYQENFNF